MPAEEPVISARRPCSPKESSTATGLEFVMKKGLGCLVETDRTGGGEVGLALRQERARNLAWSHALGARTRLSPA